MKKITINSSPLTKKISTINLIVLSGSWAGAPADALLAGIAVASARKYSLKEIAKYGASCCPANCMRHKPGMIYKEYMEMLLR